MPAAAMAAPAETPPPGSVSAASDDPVALGAQLVEDNGCTACHSADSETLVGPGWGGLYGSDRALDDGTSAHADEAYLIEAIMDPEARIAAGFDAGVMPPYAEILDAEQLGAIVAYLRSLGGEEQ